MSDSFSESRAAHLKSFDQLVAELRAIAADSGWCNPNFPPYKEALESLQECCLDIARLNSAQLSGTRMLERIASKPEILDKLTTRLASNKVVD